MSTSANPASDARINFPELLARVDNDFELLRDLIAIFKAEFPPQLASLESAVDRSDAPEVLKISHSLKGMLANLAVTKGAASASDLERLARAGDSASFPRAFAAFAIDVRGLLTEMESRLAEAQQ